MAKKPSTSTIPKSSVESSFHQTKIFNPDSFQNDNIPFGDNIHCENEIEGFLFHNIKGIKDEFNWMQINLTMLELNITCFGLVEINTTLQGIAFSKWNEITRKSFKYSRSSSSESDITFNNQYIPGGTLTTVIGSWQSQITKKDRIHWDLGVGAI
jgi:hypothetical protein